jgi:fructose/tagatose bisphosphate aldolase
MLATLKEVLADARANHYAVPGFDCTEDIYTDERVAMCRGLKKAAATQQRSDPLPADMFGPIRAELAGVVAEKIELLYAKNRIQHGRNDP